MWRLVRLLLSLVILFVGTLIFWKSLDYYDPDFEQGYLLGKADFFGGIYQYGLYAHIISTPLLLLLGTAQIFLRYEYRFSTLHKWLGRFYGVLVLSLAAPGALIMAEHALGGIWGKANFYLLAILWILTTAAAWYFARKGKIVRHQEFIIRSYILAVSAINLRLFSFVFIYFFEWSGPDMYVWSAWLSWLPFLLIYEVLRIFKK